LMDSACMSFISSFKAALTYIHHAQQKLGKSLKSVQADGE